MEKYVPQYEVWAFGSRAKWTAKEFSDLDLAIISDRPIPFKIISSIEEDLSEAPLPYKVDILDWAKVSEDFKKIILEEKVIIANKCSKLIKYPLKRIVEISNNFDALRKPVKSSDRRSGPYPYYGAQGIVDYVDEYIFDGEYVLIAEDGENLRSLKEPIALWATGKFWVNNHAHILQGNQYSDSRFLFYAINSLDVSGHITGSTIPKLSQGSLNNILVYAPPLPEQRAIAHILGTLDDKIECNRRMNETLEAMARAIFKDWFVDFGPVRAKAEGRQPEGMSAELAALFPDSFHDAENAFIPVGWQVVPLADLVAFNPRESLRKGEKATYAEMADLPIHSCCVANFRLREFTSGTKFRRGDTLLARITPCLENGKTAFVHFLAEGEVGWGSTEFIVFRAKKGIPEEFCYILAREEIFRDFAIKSMTGSSGRQRVQAESLASYSIASPQPSVWRAFGEIVQPWFRMIFANTVQSQTLAQLRDTLLPKLISGELRVKDAEKFVAEAL